MMPFRRRAAHTVNVVAVATIALGGVGACSPTPDSASTNNSNGGGATQSGSSTSTSPDYYYEDFVNKIDASLQDNSYVMTGQITDPGHDKDGRRQPRGSIRYRGAVAGDALTMTVIRIDNMIYMHLGEMTQNKYIPVDISDVDYGAAGSPTGFGSMNLAAELKDQMDAITGVERSGPVIEVNGVKAQEYEVYIDAREMVSPQADRARESLKELEAQIGEAVDAELTFFYWIDEKHRPTRATCCGQRGTLEPIETMMTINYTDWGIETDINAPPADQITTESPFMADATGA